MRRYNVVKDGKLVVKSFEKIDQLTDYLDEINIPVTVHILKYNQTISDKLWDLNVGKCLFFNKYKISCAGKKRIGNQLFDGTSIGVKNDNN
jgi:hypothetical protein